MILHKDSVTFMNQYASNNVFSKYMKQKSTKKEKSAVIVKYWKTPESIGRQVSKWISMYQIGQCN